MIFRYVITWAVNTGVSRSWLLTSTTTVFSTIRSGRYFPTVTPSYVTGQGALALVVMFFRARASQSAFSYESSFSPGRALVHFNGAADHQCRDLIVVDHDLNRSRACAVDDLRHNSAVDVLRVAFFETRQGPSERRFCRLAHQADEAGGVQDDDPEASHERERDASGCAKSKDLRNRAGTGFVNAESIGNELNAMVTKRPALSKRKASISVI